MSIDPFPERVTPRKLCQRNETINSTITLGKLLRLSEFLHDNQGQAKVYLRFDKNDAGHCVINGTVSATLSMQCQRCLEGTSVHVQSDLAIQVAEDEAQAGKIEEASTDPLDSLEVVVCDNGELDLLSLIEDELIMSLPIVANHDDVHCSEHLNSLQEKDSESDRAGQGNIKGLDALEKLKEELQKNSNSDDQDSNTDRIDN